MTLSAEKIADIRLKRLEMLQSAIARMAGYSASLKNYCLTLLTAIAGFTITIKVPATLLLGLLPITIFALLDGQYLRLERRFRELFSESSVEPWDQTPSFAFDVSSPKLCPLSAAISSWSVGGFYGSLAALLLLATIIAGQVYGWA